MARVEQGKRMPEQERGETSFREGTDSLFAIPRQQKERGFQAALVLERQVLVQGEPVVREQELRANEENDFVQSRHGIE